MTGGERSELREMRDEMFAQFNVLDAKVDAIEQRLDRWDGAITLIRTTAGILGFGGLVVLLRALSG